MHITPPLPSHSSGQHISHFSKNTTKSPLNKRKTPSSSNHKKTPIKGDFFILLVGWEGLEPPTRPLWAASSNQLSYQPKIISRIPHEPSKTRSVRLSDNSPTAPRTKLNSSGIASVGIITTPIIPRSQEHFSLMRKIFTPAIPSTCRSPKFSPLERIIIHPNLHKKAPDCIAVGGGYIKYFLLARR